MLPRSNSFRHAVPAVLLGITIFSAGFGIGKTQAPNTVPGALEGTGSVETPGVYSSIKNLDTVWSTLQRDYYDASKLDQKKLEQFSIKGFVAGIGDPYTVFMTPSESKDFSSELEGELEGIGAMLDQKDGAIVVVTTLKNSPAAKAGLLPKDVLLKVDDVSTEGMSILETVKKIRGAKGSSVKVTLGRKGNPEPIEVTIVRDTVVIESVTLEKLPKDVVHLSVIQFNDHTKKEFEAAVQEILLSKPRGIVLDLRGNGGGYLETSIDLLSEFIRGEKVGVIVKRRDAAANTSPTTNGSARLADFPLVVLVDGGSASASEILAGALQDYKRAVLVGTKTFGKGSVQELVKLKDGSILRETIAKWFTPLDRTIDLVGIHPDIEVTAKPEEVKAGKDRQLETAVRYIVGN